MGTEMGSAKNNGVGHMVVPHVLGATGVAADGVTDGDGIDRSRDESNAGRRTLLARRRRRAIYERSVAAAI
jgi:hypothetical protein